jgi:peroxiredoxin
MAVTSTMLALGTEAPAFSLTDTVTGNTVSLSDYADETGVLVMFICNHCPYVKHVRSELAAIGRDYQGSGIGMVAISANDPAVSPGDSPELMKDEARAQGYVFPYLYDETQEVAAAFTAMCTPDFFLFGSDRTLVYRGRMDESRPDSGIPVTGKELRAALDAVLAGEAVSDAQHPSMGCSIKWAEGRQPAYFG